MAVLLTGCGATPAVPPKAAPATSPAPALSKVPPLPIAGAQRYRVVGEQSQLRVRVYREGPLADIGHNHVIVTSDIEGRIYLHRRLADSGFALRIPLAGLIVDPPVARAEEGAGFDSRLSTGDRAGTRANMLGPKGLDAKTYPDITLRSVAIVGPDWYPRITVRVTLHGVSRDYIVPTAVARTPDRLTAIGGLRLRQSDFGITPFSALGGGLRVGDALDIAFRIVAVPVQ